MAHINWRNTGLGSAHAARNYESRQICLIYIGLAQHRPREKKLASTLCEGARSDLLHKPQLALARAFGANKSSSFKRRWRSVRVPMSAV